MTKKSDLITGTIADNLNDYYNMSLNEKDFLAYYDDIDDFYNNFSNFMDTPYVTETRQFILKHSVMCWNMAIKVRSKKEIKTLLNEAVKTNQHPQFLLYLKNVQLLTQMKLDLYPDDYAKVRKAGFITKDDELVPWVTFANIKEHKTIPITLSPEILDYRNFDLNEKKFDAIMTVCVNNLVNIFNTTPQDRLGGISPEMAEQNDES